MGVRGGDLPGGTDKIDHKAATKFGPDFQGTLSFHPIQALEEDCARELQRS
jgi:hypothetical protein